MLKRLSVLCCDPGDASQEEGFQQKFFLLGWQMIKYATAKCDRGFVLESEDVLDVLKGGYSALAYANGTCIRRLRVDGSTGSQCTSAWHTTILSGTVRMMHVRLEPPRRRILPSS